MMREPLLHFLLLGALLFVAYGLAHRGPEASPQRIVVSQGQIEHMMTSFGRTWQRPPTAQELKGLIDQFVREEVLSREATALGLERNDVIIRRRLQQKMEFIAEDLAGVPAPTEADLTEYLTQHADVFRQDHRLTFRHIYLNPEKHGARLDSVAANVLARLMADGAQADISVLGDPTLLQPAYGNESQSRIEATFGAKFAATLTTLPIGQWSGPVNSEFGTHLVLIEQRTDGRVPALDEVRAQVLREWENAKRSEANRTFLEQALKKYEVTIEWPQAKAERGGAQ